MRDNLVENPYDHNFKLFYRMEPFDFFKLYIKKKNIFQRLWAYKDRKKFIYNFCVCVQTENKNFNSEEEYKKYSNLQSVLIRDFIPNGSWNETGQMFFNDNVCLCQSEVKTSFFIYFKNIDDFFLIKLKL